MQLILDINHFKKCKHHNSGVPVLKLVNIGAWWCQNDSFYVVEHIWFCPKITKHNYTRFAIFIFTRNIGDQHSQFKYTDTIFHVFYSFILCQFVAKSIQWIDMFCFYYIYHKLSLFPFHGFIVKRNINLQWNNYYRQKWNLKWICKTSNFYWKLKFLNRINCTIHDATDKKRFILVHRRTINENDENDKN